MWKWVNGEYPLWFMEQTVAWYQDHNLIQAHAQDAVAQAGKRK